MVLHRKTLRTVFFIMTQLSHEQKKKDLESLGAFLQLGIKFKWDDEGKW